MPFTQFSVEVSDETGSDSSLPLYSWNGPAFGTQDAKWEWSTLTYTGFEQFWTKRNKWSNTARCSAPMLRS